MAVMNGDTRGKPNAGVLSSDEKEENSTTGLPSPKSRAELGEDITLNRVFNHLIESIFDLNTDQNSGVARPPMAARIKKSFRESAPMFREAILNTRTEVLLWTRRGSPLRALLVVSVGIVTLLALTGMLLFVGFFVAASVNVILISLLISLAAVGGFLAIFFACMTAIYIGVLVTAAFVTFFVTIASILAALVAAGWIGFIWITWLAISKSANLAKSIASSSSQHNF